MNHNSGFTNRFASSWKIFIRNPLGKAGLALLMIFAFMALASFALPFVDDMYDPMTGVDPLVLHSVGPSMTHWLGTDFIGRDIFCQLLEGSKIAFIVGLASAFISIVIGTIVGMVSGYAGGVVDMLLMRLADMVMVLPSLVILLIIAALFGQLNIWMIVFLIAVLRWPAVARVIRSQTLSLKQRPFIEASRVAGASNFRIVFKHIMPNVLPLAFLYMTFRVTSAILVEASLSVSGIWRSRADQLGNDAAVGVEFRAYVPGSLLAVASGYLYQPFNPFLLHGGTCHGRGAGPQITKGGEIIMALLTVENLTVGYESAAGMVKAVDDVSFSIESGHSLGFVGNQDAVKPPSAWR